MRIRNLYTKSRRCRRLAVFVLATIIIGCQGSGEEQPSTEHTVQTSIMDTKTVALDSNAPGIQQSKSKPLYSDDGRIDFGINRSVINLRLHSSNEMLLTDPEGRRTGIDPLSGRSFAEIPYSSYEAIGLANLVTGDPGPTTQELAVTEPVNGDFSIRIVCTYEDVYSIEIKGYDKAGDFGHLIARDVPIKLYSIHTYSLRYKKGNEKDLDSMTLRGGYDGTGDEEGDANLPLSYNTCSSSDIELPAETKQYSLGIWYYEGTDPKSFIATLNGKDITALFAPKANSNEVVTLDLSQGSNNLVLTIEGDVQSRKLVDTDTFEITVSP